MPEETAGWSRLTPAAREWLRRVIPRESVLRAILDAIPPTPTPPILYPEEERHLVDVPTPDDMAQLPRSRRYFRESSALVFIDPSRPPTYRTDPREGGTGVVFGRTRVALQCLGPRTARVWTVRAVASWEVSAERAVSDDEWPLTPA